MTLRRLSVDGTALALGCLLGNLLVLGACSLPTFGLFGGDGGATDGGGGGGDGGGGGSVRQAFDWLRLLVVLMIPILVGLSYALPGTRPAVVAFISALFRILSAGANLVALIPELLVAVLRQLVPDRWKPERWRDDDLGGTPGGTKA